MPSPLVTVLFVVLAVLALRVLVPPVVDLLFGRRGTDLFGDGRKQFQYARSSAVGVVIEGEPGICYEPGLYIVEPRRQDGERYLGLDWSTRTFPVGWTAVRFTGTIEDDWLVADGLVRVTDPIRVWYQTEDVDAPIESALEQCLREEAAAGTDPEQLSAAAIADRAETYGLELEQLFVETATHETYELETKTGQFVDIEILIDEDGPAPEDRLGVLRELLGEAVEPGEIIADLDAKTINERASTEHSVRVFEVEIFPPADADEQKQAEQFGGSSTESGRLTEPPRRRHE
jgi:hypothetical protein